MTSNSDAGRPNIFNYRNYRIYLKDFISHLRGIGGYSERKFAVRAGFKAFSFMRMIISGKRRPSRGSIERISFGLRLNHLERQYLILLWAFDQATTLEERKFLLRSLFYLKSSRLKKEVVNSGDVLRARLTVGNLEELRNWLRMAQSKAAQTSESTSTVEVSIQVLEGFDFRERFASPHST